MILNDILDESSVFRQNCLFVDAMITPSQCRAARALLDWSQLDLAKQSRVGVVTIRQLEAGVHDPRPATLQVVRQALERAGVEFIDENGGGAGVRLKKPGRTMTKR
jgi:transcriptional regulator with XRE-family HTH domain